MKTSLRTKMIAVLSVIFAFACALTIMTGVRTAKANAINDISDVSVEIEKAASIKTEDPMGIRFTASVSAAEYEFLKANNATFGVLLCPSDFIDDEVNHLKIGGWTIDEESVSEYPGAESAVSGAKYFQRATVSPIYDAKTDTYVFRAAFVGIKDTNYAREFSARAYVEIDGEDPVYSDLSTRAVYTVATYAYEAGDFENYSEDAQTYFKGVMGKVHTEYTVLNLKVENITDGKALADSFEVGDQLKISAVAKNSAGKEIEAKPVVVYGAGHYMSLNDDGVTYTIEAKGDFAIGTTVYGSVPSEYNEDGTVKSWSSKNILKYARVDNEEVPVTELKTTEFDNCVESGFLSLSKELAPTTLTKVTENIPEGAPDGEDVYLYNGQNGASNKLIIDKGRANIPDRSYLTFKYYYEGVAMRLREQSFNITNTNYVIEPSTPSGFYGLWAIKQYDKDGNLITNAAEYAACKNSWITVEIKVDQTPTNNEYDIHLDSAAGVYFTDFAVSNMSIAGRYTDYQISVSGATGEDGVAKPGDLLTISMTAIPFGKTEREEISAKIDFTEGALNDNGNGTYTYLGTGDFTITANYFDASATLDVTGIEGIIPVVETFVPTTNGSMTITAATEAELKTLNDVAGKSVYNMTATATGTQGSGFQILKGNDKAYDGKYISFSYYVATSPITMSLSETDMEVLYGDRNSLRTGAWQYRNYDKFGNLIADSAKGMTTGLNIIKGLAGQWINVEIYMIANGTSGLWIHYDSVGTVYFADFKVSNYSIYNETYSNLAVELSGATGENRAFNPSDEVSVNITANKIGVVEKVTLSLDEVALTFTDGALVLTDGKYIYQGTGDFAVTAKYYGLTATANATGIEGIIKEINTIELNSSYVFGSNFTMEKAPDMTGTEIDTSSVDTVYKLTSSQAGSSTGIYIYKNADKATVNGKYVTFKYYYEGMFSYGYMALTDMDMENASGSKTGTYYGNLTMNSYDKNGNLLTSALSNEQVGQWITVEVYVESIGSTGLRLHFDSADTVYFADFKVANYSLFAE